MKRPKKKISLALRFGGFDFKPVALVVIFIVIVALFSPQSTTNKSSSTAKSQTDAKTTAELFSQINPKEGYQINASYGDIGPKMIDLGVIDLAKFKDLYEKSSQPLTEEQLTILTKGSDKKITIAPDNSYFLLNFFWAFGLANKTKILDEGEMTKYGQNQVGNFASTGGWSLGKNEAMQYYSKRAIIPLTADQENLVNQVASNIYRPCCGNSTAFPDCNHGMALLGVLELMAANGAGETEMYQSAKYFNAFWFPSNYYDLALYFKNKEGKDFQNIDPKVLLSRDFSSASGWQNIKNWLAQQGIIPTPPKQGGSCGV